MTGFGANSKKTVRWNNRCDVRVYRYNYNGDGNTCFSTTTPLWYTPEEIQGFKDDRIETILLCYELGLEYVNSFQDDYTSRGLENFMITTRKMKKRRKQEIMDVVFDEQERQVNEYGTIYSPTTLAQYYKYACKESLFEAHKRGEDYWLEEQMMLDEYAMYLFSNQEEENDTTQSCDKKKNSSFPLGKAAIIFSMVNLGSMVSKWSLRQIMPTTSA